MTTLGKEFKNKEHIPAGTKVLVLYCDGSAAVFTSCGEPSQAQPWLSREFEILDPKKELVIDD